MKSHVFSNFSLLVLLYFTGCVSRERVAIAEVRLLNEGSNSFEVDLPPRLAPWNIYLTSENEVSTALVEVFLANVDDGDIRVDNLDLRENVMRVGGRILVYKGSLTFLKQISLGSVSSESNEKSRLRFRVIMVSRETVQLRDILTIEARSIDGP